MNKNYYTGEGDSDDDGTGKDKKNRYQKTKSLNNRSL